MLVVHVRKVGVPMGDDRMPVRVQVWFAAVPGKVMFMLVMVVVHMPMRVVQRLMGVLVLVALPDMQPDTDGHQGRRHPERPARRFGPEGQ